MQTHVHKLHVKNCDENGCFSGYASIFNIQDSQGDVVMKGAFQKSLKTWHQQNKWPKMLWQHDAGQPIGFWTDIYEDQHGLFVMGQLMLDLQKGREAYALLKTGVIDSLSIGFRLIKSGRRPGGRFIQEVDLQEISLVTFAANEQARVCDVKNAFGLGAERWLQRLLDLQRLLMTA